MNIQNHHSHAQSMSLLESSKPWRKHRGRRKMNKENTDRLMEEFPGFWKHLDKGPRFTLMVFGFECGNGWFDLIHRLCTDIQVELDKPGNEELKERFWVVQVKEKYAGLRFYVSGASSAIHSLIRGAERESYETCEDCGAPGQPKKGGWYRTLCDRHAEERGQTEVMEMNWTEDK